MFSLSLLKMRTTAMKTAPLEFYNRMKIKIMVRISWPWIYATSLFWAYGYEASPGYLGIRYELLLIVAFAGGLAAWIITSVDECSGFIYSLKVAPLDVLIAVAPYLTWIIIAGDLLSLPLSGDELYYAIKAELHQIFFLKALFSHYEINALFGEALYWLNLACLLAAIIIIYCWRRYIISRWVALLALFSVTLIVRYLIISFGGGGNPHGPLHLLSIWLTTTLFGVSDYAFHLSSTIPFAILSCYIYLTSVNEIGRSKSLLLTFICLYVPMNLYVSTMLEASAWVSCAGSILLISLNKPEKKQDSALAISSMVSIACLVRISAIYMIPAMIYGFVVGGDLKKGARSLCALMMPFFIAFPYVLKTIIIGTPATDSVSNVLDMDSINHRLLGRIYGAIKSGAVVDNIVDSAGMLWSMIPISLILSFKGLNGLKGGLSVTLFFVCGIFVFYSISPGLWGTVRYQSEYYGPIVVLSLFAAFMAFHRNKIIYPVILFYLLYAIFIGLPHVLQRGSELAQYMEKGLYGSYSRCSEARFYRGFISEIGGTEAVDKSYIFGHLYGVMPFILSGYRALDVLSMERRYPLAQKSNPVIDDDYLGNNKIELIAAPLDIKIDQKVWKEKSIISSVGCGDGYKIFRRH